MFNKPNLLTPYLGSVKDNLLDEFDFKKSRWNKKNKQILKYILLFLGVLLAILALNLFMVLSDVKQVYNSAFLAKSNLEQSIYSVKHKDFDVAIKFSQQANDEFAISLARLKRIKYTPIGWLPIVHGKINDVIYLTETGKILSQTIKQGSGIGKVFFSIWSNDKLIFSQLDTKQKQMILAKIYEYQKTLPRINNNLKHALNNLKQIKNRDLFMSRDIDIDQLKIDVQNIQKTTEFAIPIFKTLPILAGYPKESNYLFVLQNKDELRPTGGFIGTYGTAKVRNGDIIELKTDDIYHLDMPSLYKLKIDPPQPMKDYLHINRWLMRDANWSPDWPTSAKKILWFYKQEAKINRKKIDDVDFVVALNPNFIIDLIKITGPIKVNHQIYNQDNFVSLLQDTTGKNFYNQGISRWHRKKIIGEITKKIKLKLFDSLDKNWSKLIAVVEKNLDQKNIIIFAKQTKIAKIFYNNNWDGHLRKTSSDYVMVVDSNLAALKTDAVMKRNINYQVIEKNNKLYATLRINYANQGNFTWKTTRYRTYTRVYVPLGSKLIRVLGFSQGKIKIGQELDKTYFGAFINIEPGKFGSLVFEYQLPQSIKQNQYSLIIQKQPGTETSLDVDLNFKNRIKSYQPVNFNSTLINEHRIKFKSKLILDNEYYINF